MVVDLEALTQQVTAILSYSQNKDTSFFPHVRKLIDQWWESKERFFNMFNNQLIWEDSEPISIDYDDEIKNGLFEQFIDHAIRYLDESDEGRGEIDDWEEWIVDNKKGFFINTVVAPYPSTDMKKGMKLLRAFKYFDFSEDALRYLQDLASQYIQKTKIEGTLCFSIHPLDFLSLSDNESNWRSCHALDGEYRAGNLSYMLDPSTVVCYIKSKNDVQLKRFPPNLKWNNKKWRILLHIHSQYRIMYVNRQYPFSCDMIVKRLLETPIMQDIGFSFSDYQKDRGLREVNGMPLNQNYFWLHGFLMNPLKICGGDNKSMQYNDFAYSPHYLPQYVHGRNGRCFFTSSFEQVENDFSVPIGVRVLCPGCGQEIIEESDSFLCETCKDASEGILGQCNRCGTMIYENDPFGEDEEGCLLFCEDCARELMETDEYEME